MRRALARTAPLLACGLLLASASSTRASEPPAQRHVTVSASATVTAEPDIAMISTGVVTEAQSAREALSRNTAAMKGLIDSLKSAGVAPRDIQTTAFSVEPRYEQGKGPRPPAIVGYRVVNQVRITAREIARLGEVLDQAVTLGSNQIGGIQFDVSKAETLKDEARRAAIANAHRRASLFAAAAGAVLGEVVAIEEDVQIAGPRPPRLARAMAPEAVPIEPGGQALEARVTVTWALK